MKSRGMLVAVAGATAASLSGVVPAGEPFGAGQDAVHRVGTIAEFQAALARAAPGDTISLSAADWSILDIRGRRYSRQITITGAAGVHVSAVELEDATGIRFSGLSVGTLRGWGNTITIESCSFKDAEQLIRVNGGSGWTIQRNRFGQNGQRAAVRFIPLPDRPRIENVRFVNNIMRSVGGNQSGFESDSAAREEYRPRNIVVANNTIMTPKPGVLLANGWEKRAVSERPVIANNVFAHMFGPHLRRGRFISNVAREGVTAPGVQIGPDNLRSDLSPSARSKLVVGRAARAWAPPRDFYNRLRVGLPDRGAIEYRPTK
jgi:hypothetical protein